MHGQGHLRGWIFFFFFAWVTSGFRTHWSCSPLGKMCTTASSCLPMPPLWAYTTCQGIQTRTPAFPVCLLCSKTLFGTLKGDVCCGKLWQLYTTFNIHGVPPISLPPPVVRYTVRSSSNSHNYSVTLSWKEMRRDPHETHPSGFSQTAK